MRKLDHLICSGEEHLLNSHNIAAPNGTDAQLLLLSWLVILASVIFLGILTVHGLVDTVCQRQCRTAGRILL